MTIDLTGAPHRGWLIVGLLFVIGSWCQLILVADRHDVKTRVELQAQVDSLDRELETARYRFNRLSSSIEQMRRQLQQKKRGRR